MATHDSTTSHKQHTVEIGSRFGRWEVIGLSDRLNNAGRRVYLLCRCDCGIVRDVGRSGLTSGMSQSCGCLHRERVTTHSGSKSPTYRNWAAMIERCCSPSAGNFAEYGGRGISVCDRWRESFEAFASDMGERPDNMSIDRIDNDGNYDPGNCRWATAIEQQRNKRDNHILEHDGRRLTIVEWSEITGLAYSTIQSRLERGWEVARVLSPDLAYLTGTKSHAGAKVNDALVLGAAKTFTFDQSPTMRDLAELIGLRVNQVGNSILRLRKRGEWPYSWPSSTSGGHRRTQINTTKRS
jgi:hypothetical protein